MAEITPEQRRWMRDVLPFSGAITRQLLDALDAADARLRAQELAARFVLGAALRRLGGMLRIPCTELVAQDGEAVGMFDDPVTGERVYKLYTGIEPALTPRAPEGPQ